MMLKCVTLMETCNIYLATTIYRKHYCCRW